MKIDVVTLNILKNFSKFNNSIFIEEGNVLQFISGKRTVAAKATVPTIFPRKFGIYELTRLIAIISLFKDPDLIFKDNYVEIVGDGRSAKYYYSSEEVITKVKKLPTLKTHDVVFKLTNQQLVDVDKAAGVLGLQEIVISGDGENLYLQVADVKNPTGNVYSINIGKTNKTFKAIFVSENLKILPCDYEATISFSGIMHLRGEGIEYWVSMNDKSTFG
jgi:hypothetical protein